MKGTAKLYEYGPLCPAILVRRYKRFLVDAEIPGRGIVTGFCPNSGSMKGCSEPGSQVMLSFQGRAAGRKTDYTLEMVKAGSVWVGVNTLLTNTLASSLLRNHLVRELSRYHIVRREVGFGDSRLDFLLSFRKGTCYVEVKSVTMRRGTAAEFPDAVTLRGRKHLESLLRAKASGYGAFMLYIVQRSDCGCFRPAADIDPGYSEAVKAAEQNGVALLAYSVGVEPEGIYFQGPLPFCNRTQKGRTAIS